MRKILCVSGTLLFVILLMGCGKRNESFTPVPSAAVQDPAQAAGILELMPEDDLLMKAAVDKKQILAESGADTALYYIDKTKENFEGVFLKKGNALTFCGWESIPVTAQISLMAFDTEASFLQVVYSYTSLDEKQETVIHLIDPESGGEILFESPEELLDQLGVGILSGVQETAEWENLSQPLVYEEIYPLRKAEDGFVCDMEVSNQENTLLCKLQFFYEFDGTGLVFAGIRQDGAASAEG